MARSEPPLSEIMYTLEVTWSIETAKEKGKRDMVTIS